MNLNCESCEKSHEARCNALIEKNKAQAARIAELEAENDELKKLLVYCKPYVGEFGHLDNGTITLSPEMRKKQLLGRRIARALGKE